MTVELVYPVFEHLKSLKNIVAVVLDNLVNHIRSELTGIIEGNGCFSNIVPHEGFQCFKTVGTIEHIERIDGELSQ